MASARYIAEINEQPCYDKLIATLIASPNYEVFSEDLRLKRFYGKKTKVEFVDDKLVIVRVVSQGTQTKVIFPVEIDSERIERAVKRLEKRVE